MKKLVKVVVGGLVAAAACSVFAQKAGDNVVSMGVASINPNTQLGTFTSTNPLFQGALTNASGSISNETTVSFSLLHMFSDDIGAEFTMGLPPRHTLDLVTPAASPLVMHPGAATVKTWTPAVVGKYFFFGPQDTFRPYVGLGVSRVSFHSVSVNQNDALVAELGGSGASLSSVWTPVYNVGAIYQLNDRWSLNGSISYLPIKTTATFNGSGAVTTGDIKINTTDYVLRLGYRF